MDHQHTCESCGGFIPRTELLIPRCNNTGTSPLSEPKMNRIRRHGCPIWSPAG